MATGRSEVAAAGAASARQRTPVQRCARLLSPILVALVYAAYKMATVGVEDEHSVTGAAVDGALTSFKVLSAVQVSDLDVPLSTGTLPRSPRLLTGAAATQWRGTQWTLEAVVDAVPVVRRAKASGSGRFTYFDRTQPWSEHVLPTALDVPAVSSECMLRATNCEAHGEWADHSMIDVSRIKYYATLRLDSAEAAEMRDKLGPVDLLSVDNATHRGNMWMSSPGTSTTIHYDHEHNVFVQLVGRKKFTLVAPRHQHKLHLHPASHPSWRQSQVANPLGTRDRLFPLFKEVPAFTVEVGPGDVLYIPPFWFHYVQAIDACVSVNVWSESEEGRIVEELAAAPLPFDASSQPDELAVLARAHIRSVFNALFKSDGGAGPVLQDMLESRYAAVVNDHRNNQPPPSVWLHFLGSQRADEVREQIGDTNSDLRRKVMDCAREVVKLLARLGAGARRIAALDHAEAVSSLAVQVALDNARARGAGPEAGQTRKLTGVPAGEPAVLHTFVFLRDALLSEEGTPPQRSSPASNNGDGAGATAGSTQREVSEADSDGAGESVVPSADQNGEGATGSDHGDL